jgi:hypothetical protein
MQQQQGGRRYPTPSPVPDRSNELMSSALYADWPSTFSPAAWGGAQGYSGPESQAGVVMVKAMQAGAVEGMAGCPAAC